MKRAPAKRSLLEKRQWFTDWLCTHCHRSKRATRGGRPVGKPYLYLFQRIHEDGRVEYLSGQFCSVACLRAVHKG